MSIDNEESDEVENDASNSTYDFNEFNRVFEALDRAISNRLVDQTSIDMYWPWVTWLNNGKAKLKPHVKLFYDEILPRTVKIILARKYDPSRVVMVNTFLVSLAQLAIHELAQPNRGGEHAMILLEVILLVSSPLALFYTTNNLLDEEDVSLLRSSTLSDADETTNRPTLNSTEADALKVGDVVHLIETGKSGVILEQSPTETEIKIGLENGLMERWVCKKKELFAKTSFDIGLTRNAEEARKARFERDTRVQELFRELESKNALEQFRNELEPGVLCDAENHDDGLWYQSCVVQIDDEAENCIITFLGFPQTSNRSVSKQNLVPLNLFSGGRRGPGVISSTMIELDEMDAAMTLSTRVAHLMKPNSLALGRIVRLRPSFTNSLMHLNNCEALLEFGLMEILQNAIPENMLQAFAGFNQIAPYVADQVCYVVFRPVLMKTIESIQGLGPEYVRNITKSTVSRVCLGLGKLIRRSLSRAQAYEHVELVRLEFINKRLESEIILQRINGVTSLNELIEECQASEAYPGGLRYEDANGFYVRIKTTLFLKLPALAQWSSSKRFLDGFFSNATGHCELIKRSNKLVELLCLHGNYFSLKDFETIWTAAMKSDDEEIVEATMALLGQCCPLFSLEIRLTFCNRLIDLDITKPTTLSLFKTLIQHQHVVPELAQAACNLLWHDAVMNESELSCAAIEAGLVAFQATAPPSSSCLYTTLREKLVSRCVEEEGLRNLRSVRILRATILTFPVDHPVLNTANDMTMTDSTATVVVKTRHCIVEWLCNDLHLPDVLFESMDINSVSDEESRARLEFLWFVLCSSKSTELDLKTIDALWEKFPVGSTRRDAFLMWLAKACRMSTPKIVPASSTVTMTTPPDSAVKELTMSVSTLALVFERFCTNPEFHSLAGFRCFHQFLVAFNVAQGNMVSGGQPPLDGIRICNGDWVGQDTLWRAAVELDSTDQVAENAATVITNLHQRLMPNIQDQVWAVRKQLVEKIDTRARRVLERGDAGVKDFAVLVRCTNLMRGIFRGTEFDIARRVRAEYAASSESEFWSLVRPRNSFGPFSDEGVSLLVHDNIKGSPSHLKAIQVVLRLTDPIAKLRCLIAQAAQVEDVDDVKLFEGGSEILLTHDAKPISMLQTLFVLACRRSLSGPVPSSLKKESFLTELNPHEFVNTASSAVDLFLDSLEWVGGILQNHDGLSNIDRVRAELWMKESWKLLDTLPCTKTMSRADFDPLARDLSTFRILYALPLVQQKLHGSRKPLDDSRQLIMSAQSLLSDFALRRVDETDTLRVWNILALGLCISVVRDLAYALLDEAPLPFEKQGAVATIMERQTSILKFERSSQADLLEIAHLLNDFDCANVQQVVVHRFLPFLLESSLKIISEEEDQRLSKSVRVAVELWFAVVRLDANLFDSCFTSAKDERLLAMMLHCNAELCQRLLCFCVAKRSPSHALDLFLNACLECLPCSNVYLLKLTRNLLVAKIEGDGDFDFQALFHALAIKLNALPISEGSPFPQGQPYTEVFDDMVVGLLSIMSLAAGCCRSFDRLGFDAVADCVLKLENTKCERPTSRKMAFKVLKSLCNAYPQNADELLTGLIEGELGGRFSNAITKWNMDLASDLRSPLGLSGLINLGCTCYANSLVQQLWMIPHIRAGLSIVAENMRLVPDDTEDDGLALLKSLAQCSNRLSHGTHRACTLEPFMRRFKDENGLPANVLEQQDSQEFFEKTCDRLDDTLAASKHERLFRSSVSVTIASELICLDDLAQERRDDGGVLEWALKIELTKGGSTLEQSLEKFVSGSVLSDFRWKDGGPTMRTLKRQCVSLLSDTLPIHIKRFQLNWETLVTEKSNDRLSFPLELDMFPFTKEGLAYQENRTGRVKYSILGRGEEYYKYTLAGVLVHAGASINSGHYFSHIKSRLPGPTFGNWYTFNDSFVSKFDLKDLPEQTFGGTTRESVYCSETRAYREFETVLTHSAYMLFYERRRNGDDGKSTQPPEPLMSEEVRVENNDHRLALRLYDPGLLNLLASRCGHISEEEDGDIKVDPAAAASTLKDHLPTESQALLSLVARKFIFGDSILCRSSLADKLLPAFDLWLREFLRKSTEESESILNAMTIQDVTSMFFLCPNMRARLRYRSLMFCMMQVAKDDIAWDFLKKVLTRDVVDQSFSEMFPDNSFWHVISWIVRARPHLPLKAYGLGVLPEIFDALLGVESPTFDWDRPENVTGLGPRHQCDKLTAAIKTSSHVSIELPSGVAESAVDTAIYIVCHLLDLGDQVTMNHILGMDKASMVCLRSAQAWASLIRFATPEALKLILTIFAKLQTPDRTLANLLSKAASVLGVEAISKYYQIVSEYAALKGIPFDAWFFVGLDTDMGFFRRAIHQRSISFSVSCICEMVEIAEVSFPNMVCDLATISTWLPDVDRFLKDDDVTNILLPKDLERSLNTMEKMSNLHRAVGGQDDIEMVEEDVQDTARVVAVRQCVVVEHDDDVDSAASRDWSTDTNEDGGCGDVDDEDEGEENAEEDDDVDMENTAA